MTIVLGSTVIVADPVYEMNDLLDMTITLRHVLPGTYNVHVKQKEKRNSMLTVIHSAFINKPLVWKKHKSKVDVDSGQAGIFDKKSYRNDDTVRHIVWIKKKAPWRVDENENGDLWYGKMSDMTLHTKDRWGTYESGVVSSSGFGDGAYDLYTAKVNQKIIGIFIDFRVDPEYVPSFNCVDEEQG